MVNQVFIPVNANINILHWYHCFQITLIDNQVHNYFLSFTLLFLIYYSWIVFPKKLQLTQLKKKLNISKYRMPTCCTWYPSIYSAFWSSCRGVPCKNRINSLLSILINSRTITKFQYNHFHNGTFHIIN